MTLLASWRLKWACLQITPGRKGSRDCVDVGSVIEQLATNKRFQTPRQQASIFRDQQAREGIQTLISQRAKVRAGQVGAVDYQMMHDSKPGEGAALTKEKMARMEDSGLLELQRLPIDMQNDTIKHFKEYNDQIVAITKATNNLEKSFGKLGVWASSIGIGGAVAAGTSVLSAVTSASAGGATLAGAGLGTLAGATALGLAGGAVAYGGTTALLEATRDEKTGMSYAEKLGYWASDSWVANGQSRLNKNGEVDMKVQVDIKDSRTEVKTRSKARGANVDVSSGPYMRDSF